jgi:hypothetical protein
MYFFFTMKTITSLSHQRSTNAKFATCHTKDTWVAVEAQAIDLDHTVNGGRTMVWPYVFCMWSISPNPFHFPSPLLASWTSNRVWYRKETAFYFRDRRAKANLLSHHATSPHLLATLVPNGDSMYYTSTPSSAVPQWALVTLKRQTLPARIPWHLYSSILYLVFLEHALPVHIPSVQRQWLGARRPVDRSCNLWDPKLCLVALSTALLLRVHGTFSTSSMVRRFTILCAVWWLISLTLC